MSLWRLGRGSLAGIAAHILKANRERKLKGKKKTVA